MVPTWSAGDVITLGRGEQPRVLSVETEIDNELIDKGFNGMLTVEPL